MLRPNFLTAKDLAAKLLGLAINLVLVDPLFGERAWLLVLISKLIIKLAKNVDINLVYFIIICSPCDKTSS
jgi:hypothetical protein